MCFYSVFSFKTTLGSSWGGDHIYNLKLSKINDSAFIFLPLKGITLGDFLHLGMLLQQLLWLRRLWSCGVGVCVSLSRIGG